MESFKGNISDCLEGCYAFIGRCYDKQVNPCSMDESEPLIILDGWDECREGCENFREILKASDLIGHVFEADGETCADEECVFVLKEGVEEEKLIDALTAFCDTEDYGLVKEVVQSAHRERDGIKVYVLEPYRLLALYQNFLEDFQDIGFTDEWTMCGDCNTVLRTSPTHYGWTPACWVSEACGHWVCLDCFRADYKEEFLERVEAQAAVADPPSTSPIPLEEFGYAPLCEEDGTTKVYEAGLHQGQDDSPGKLAQFLYKRSKELYEAPIVALFKVYPSQFSVSFELHVPEGREQDALAILATGQDEDVKDSPSPAEAMQDMLRNGPVTTVSKEDFINGNMPKESGKYVVENN